MLNMSYMELLTHSVETCSHGALTLVEVPEELRISVQSLSALQYMMSDVIADNERARRDSYRRARSCTC